jgi:hypothetical protein
LQFDGVNDYISSPSGLPQTTLPVEYYFGIVMRLNSWAAASKVIMEWNNGGTFLGVISSFSANQIGSSWGSDKVNVPLGTWFYFLYKGVQTASSDSAGYVETTTWGNYNGSWINNYPMTTGQYVNTISIGAWTDTSNPSQIDVAEIFYVDAYQCLLSDVQLYINNKFGL